MKSNILSTLIYLTNIKTTKTVPRIWCVAFVFLLLSTSIFAQNKNKITIDNEEDGSEAVIFFADSLFGGRINLESLGPQNVKIAAGDELGLFGPFLSLNGVDNYSVSLGFFTTPYLYLVDSTGIKVNITIDDGSGTATFKGPNTKNILLGARDINPDFGKISLLDDAERPRVNIESYSNASTIELADTFGFINAELTAFTDTLTDEGYGQLSLFSDGNMKVELSGEDSLGRATFSGPDSDNVIINGGFDGNQGTMKFYGDHIFPRIEIGANQDGGSTLGLLSSTDTTVSVNVILSSSIDTSGMGYGDLKLYHGDSFDSKLELTSENDIGAAYFSGPSSTNVIIGSLSEIGAGPDLGKISLHNAQGYPTVDIVSFDDYGYLSFQDTFSNLTAKIGTDLFTIAGHGYGSLRLYSADGSESVEASDDMLGNGFLKIYSDSTSTPDNLAVSIFADDTRNGNGRIRLFQKGDATNHKASLTVTSANYGGAYFYGPNNSANTTFDVVSGNPNNGFLSASDQNGNERASMYSNTFVGGAGVFATIGANGSLNTFTGPPFGLDNNGAYAIFDANDNLKGEMVVVANGDGIVQSDIIRTLDLKASMFTNGSNQGVIQADVKNFSMPHPLLSDKRIVYACIEGPEAAAYARGTAQLNNGRGTIELPDHFRLVAAEAGMTVILTPISLQSKGLAIVSKSLDGIEVGELLDGKGNYKFDWEVKSIRKGYENYEVIRDNDKPHLKKSNSKYLRQKAETRN